MGVTVGATERLIAIVTKQEAILEAPGGLARGGLEWASRPEYTPHRQGANTQYSLANSGLTNNLH